MSVSLTKARQPAPTRLELRLYSIRKTVREERKMRI